MPWEIIFTPKAQKDLEKLGGKTKKRVLDKLIWLKNNFEEINPLPLSNKWQGFFKLRIGDWRIIYDMEEPKKRITIHKIDIRDKVYKKK